MAGLSIRVLVVDDDPLVRSALRLILPGDGIEVVGELEDGSGVIEAVARLRPTVVLMDIRMPVVDGLAATQALVRCPAPPKVLILTTFDADEQVLRALRCGASGFLLKDTAPAQIVQAVRSVADGEAVLSPSVTRTVIDRIGALDPGDPESDPRRRRALDLLGRLSDREHEVAVAVGRGLSNADIATALFLSVATVKAHVSRLLTKLEVDNRVQVALIAHDAGLT